MKKLSAAVLGLIGLGCVGVAQATIYEWVANGIPTYSDSPPSQESGMGGHYHGAYTESGVEVSISKANPETLAANESSNAEYQAQQRTEAASQSQSTERRRVEAAEKAAPHLTAGGEENALLAAEDNVPMPRGNLTVQGQRNAIIAEKLMRDTSQQR